MLKAITRLAVDALACLKTCRRFLPAASEVPPSTGLLQAFTVRRGPQPKDSKEKSAPAKAASTG
jgi:hypothetical protein